MDHPAPWIPHPTTLRGRFVHLVPLERSHFEELSGLAADKRIWEFLPFNGSEPDKFEAMYSQALVDRKKGLCYPFAVVQRSTGLLAGTTRLIELSPKDRKLEIGHSWLHPDHWSTGINTEAKFLLLSFCFENLQAVRVQLRANEFNLRSRRAIEKIGAKFEGILRKEKINYLGVPRNSAYYSIIDEEWPEIRQRIPNLHSNGSYD